MQRNDFVCDNCKASDNDPKRFITLVALPHQGADYTQTGHFCSQSCLSEWLRLGNRFCDYPRMSEK
jgi:hypothetical protein